MTLLLLAGAVACTEPVVSLQTGTRAYTPSDYEGVYQRWTRTERPFDFGRLATVLHVTATFESRELRWAYVVRYGHDFGLSTDARSAMLEASLADAQRYHRFFVTLAGDDLNESDLTHERSAWRVLLLDDRGRQTRPVEVEKIRHPTPAERKYFPSVSSQRQIFRLVFPAQGEDGFASVPEQALFAVLRFTGPEGAVDLRWDFQ